jgi:hypothetical protein
MPALDDLKARIAEEIDRTDATTPIARAITTAIAAYKATRFAFNEVEGDLTTVDGTDSYSTLTGLPTGILTIDTARIATTPTNRYLLWPVTWQRIDAVDVSGTHKGQPIWFAWYAENLRLYPTPDAAYTVNLRFLGEMTEETWATRAEALIRTRAKKELYLHYLFDAGMAATMQQIEEQELRALKREARLKQSSGRLEPHD